MVPIITPRQFNLESIEDDDPWVNEELADETPFTVQAGIQAAACILGIFLGTVVFWMSKAIGTAI